MKKIFVIVVALLAMAGCRNGGKSVSFSEVLDDFYDNQVAPIWADSTLTDEQIKAKITDLLLSTVKKHRNDSLGQFAMNQILADGLVSPDEAEAMMAKSGPVIKDDPTLARYLGLARKAVETSVGRKFIDIDGPDALTGETNSISAMLADGKPLIVDFWASWCSPCRQEIRENLTRIAQEHSDKVNILGIAVWEESSDDTVKAMQELSITWPVIFGGGRKNSCSELYGVIGIPTMVGINPDGTIFARGYGVDDVLKALNLQ